MSSSPPPAGSSSTAETTSGAGSNGLLPIYAVASSEGTTVSSSSQARSPSLPPLQSGPRPPAPSLPVTVSFGSIINNLNNLVDRRVSHLLATNSIPTPQRIPASSESTPSTSQVTTSASSTPTFTTSHNPLLDQLGSLFGTVQNGSPSFDNPFCQQDRSLTFTAASPILPAVPSKIINQIRNAGVLIHLLDGYQEDIVEFLVNGFSNGFRLGFQGPPPLSRRRNNLSAVHHVEAVSASILKELKRGHTSGPFPSPPLPNLHCSPLGSAPKKDGTLRIVLDLSSPPGISVNGIDQELCRVSYSSFDEAVSMVRSLGKGCWMAKIDIRHAFRLCPVHPDDWWLLGYEWLGRFYVDVCLLFGNRSSPCIFNAFADALQWILVHKFSISALTHYLDDFFLCSLLFSKARYWMDLIQAVFGLVRVPIAEDKLEGPTQVITYLGIEIDSLSFTIRLPSDKLTRLRELVSVWLGKRKCVKRELLSLIGSLSFACKVVRPGRIFLRRLIDLSTTVTKLHHHIDIPSSVRLDLEMWSQFLISWNGTSFLPDPPITAESISLFTDASFKGLGVYFQGQWISHAWPFDLNDLTHIAVLELFAVFAALSTFGDSLVNQQIIIFTDNESIISVWSSGSSKDTQIMAIIRELFFLTTRLNLSVRFQHVPGVKNVFADLLSRLQVDAFKSICPGCSPSPTIMQPSTMAVLETIL
ncbi:uncharacterized protein [Clytia hemisphaerica]|uniref:uncharacterized protein n=1 Tax=Clytia hemisphaerica TaxID=252671 RepID=UPI0034D72A04